MNDLEFYAATDTGMKRSQNQDSICAVKEAGFFMVADGMGGHQGGEIASKMAADILEKLIREWHASSGALNSGLTPSVLLTESLRKAGRVIYRESENNPHLKGMGTTACCFLIHSGMMTIGHVGDSRCYFIRPGAIWQVTNDHSLVQEKLRAGLISREQLKSDKMRNVITRSVGYEEDVQVEIYQMEVSEGDVFLICSDGLTGLLSDDEILRISEGKTLEAATTELISMANEHGGDDNISVIMVRVMK